MILVHTNDGRYYRRWVNLILSSLFPGSAHYISGRKKTGIAWFVLYLLLMAVLMGFLIHPQTPYSLIQAWPFDWVFLTFWFLITGDSLRRPIPRMGFIGWTVFLTICLVLPIMLALFVRAFLMQAFQMPSGSMEPTILGNRQDASGNQIRGDYIFANKFVYRFSHPRRGDVIVFMTKGLKAVQQDTCYVKRLVGLPGETVGIDPPYLLVNNKRITEPAFFSRMAEEKNEFSGFRLATPTTLFQAPLVLPSDKITLGPDEYLVLGDNARNSLDGRYFGPIKRKAIIGKAFYIYAPAERKRKVE